MKKRLVSVLLLLVLAFTLPLTAFAAAPVIEDAEYEGSGCVEVEFTSKVQYQKLKVKVKGSDGVWLAAEVKEKDSDDLTFVIPDVRPGEQYTYKISGVRTGKSGSYKSVSGTIRVPDWDPLIKELEYDKKDRELEIAFVKRVQYKNLKVTVTDADGNEYSCAIDEKNSRELELIVKGLQAGETYTVTISGIRPSSTGSCTTVLGSFRVK